MREVAVMAGALIVGAAAHVSISATGGYHAATAPLQVAVAVGLVVGAICVGSAWRERRFAVAWCLIAALVAGEAFAVIMTAERTIDARELTVAPLRDAEVAHLTAQTRVRAAEEKKDAADAAALSEASKLGCRKECRTLIEDAKADAQRELEAARADFAALPSVRSTSPLADRLGIPGWALDLITAALASIAANGLGASLVAFGSHGAKRTSQQMSTECYRMTVAPAQALPALSPHDHAVRFGYDMLAPADATTPIAKILTAYLAWCAARDQRALPPREIAAAMRDLFERAGLEIEIVDGVPHLRGARLTSTTEVAKRA